MDRLLETLDPRMRLGVWLSLASLGALCGVLILSRMTVSSWLTLLAIGVLAAGATSLSFRAWPQKQPAPVEALLDRWGKLKKNSSKSVAGRFIWKLGRSAIAALLMGQAVGMFSSIDGLFKLALIFGFALSTGFFGIQAAVWAGLIIFLLGHRLALMGLNVDFADAGSRAALMAAWERGGRMSWWWPIGFAAAAPIWVGLAAASTKVGAQISEDLAERKAAALAKKKIDARRARLKTQQKKRENDELEAARKEREKAQSHIESVARGPSADASDGAAGIGKLAPASELSGVAKLEFKSNEALLEQFIKHVRSIRKLEADDLDANTAARRAFDRRLAGLNDKQLALLRSGQIEGWEILDEYYNQLAGTEASAMAGGDGEVVTTRAVPVDVLDESEGFSEADLPASSFAGFNSGDSDDPDDLDILDRAHGRPPEEVRVVSAGTRAATAKEIDMMLSEPTPPALTEGPDGTPEGGGPLPLAGKEKPDPSANDVGTETDAGAVEQVADGVSSGIKSAEEGVAPVGADEAAAGAANEADLSEADRASSATNESANDIPSPGVGEDVVEPVKDVIDRSMEPIVNAAPSDENASADTKAPDATVVEANDQNSVDQEALSSTDEVNSNTEQEAEAGGDQPNSAGAEGSSPELSAEELRTVAGVILAGKFDREFILESMNCFSSAAEAAAAIGLPEGLLAERFEEYRALVAGAQKEKELVELLANGNLEQVRLAVAAVKDASWNADPQIVAQADEWIATKEKEERDRAEAEARAEEERLRLQEEARLKAEEEARAEAERIRLEQEAAAEAEREREQKAAEEARLAELSENRRQFAVHVLAGAYGDDLLDAGEDLFPTVETLAEALELEPNIVQAQFDAFTTKRIAKQKLAELKQAWEAHDLYQVKSLLEDKSDYEGYPGHEEILEAAAAWAQGEEGKQRVLGLKDKVMDAGPSAGDQTRRKFMRSRLKTSDRHVEIMDQDLPAAMTIVKSLQTVVSMMAADTNPAIVKEFERAKSDAANLAAEIVSHEKSCRQYLQAFFPAEHREDGVDIWSSVVDLASQATGVASDTGPEAAESPVADVVEEPRQVFADAGLDKVPTLEEIQALDPKVHLADQIYPPLQDRDHYERRYKMLLQGEIPEGVQIEDVTNSEARFFSYQLCDENGKPLGRLAITTLLRSVPLWYQEATDQVYAVAEVNGEMKPHFTSGAKFLDNLNSLFFEADPREKVRGVLFVSPYITREGIISFQPLLDKARGGPAKIYNMDLSADAVSAFVNEIKAI